MIPMKLLKKYSGAFPKAWRQINSLREDRGKDLPFWPEWCYCPIAGSLAIVTEGSPQIGPEQISKLNEYPPGVMAALAAWRVTKGIYRFDPDLLPEILSMPLEGKLPAEVFFTLPEWCIYVETPGMAFLERENAGFFSYLEYDANDQRQELRFVFVSPSLQCVMVPLHIGNWPLEESITRYYAEAIKNIKQELGQSSLFPPQDKNEFIKQAKTGLIPFLNMLLYICSVNADFAQRPIHPSKKPRRKGKIETANEPRTWEVGVRVGPALRKAKAQVFLRDSELSGEEETTRISPRSHIRRAHWHHYWTGPRSKPEEQSLILKWLPPIPVGIPEEDVDIPAVIRKINKEE